jgi:S1-C subfamily serine protease
MKHFFSFLGMAILGGILTLGGYKVFIEKEVALQQISEIPMATINSNFNPTALKTSAIENTTDFTNAAENSINAVVHVKNTAVRTQSNPLDLFFGNGNGSQKFEQVGTGSGVIISQDGYIVTNNHVIQGATDLEITLNNKQKYKAELIGTDKANDIALLKIDADMDLPYIPFANSDSVQIGEWVLAVGNPYNLTSTVTAGIVSAKGRDLEGNSAIDSFIQTDAAVNPGNSGGALVNINGELIGINTAISSRTGSFIGYSFAVPSNIAKKIVDDLLEYGSVQEAILGISIDASDPNIEGVKIGSLTVESGAKKAGLQSGDIIVKVDNVKISKFSELRGQLTAKRPGDFVDVTVDRDGEPIIKSVLLSKKIKRIVVKTFGWELQNLTKKELNRKQIKTGVKIIDTKDPDNDIAGFIITKINNKKVTSAEETAALIDQLSNFRYSNNMIEMINLDGERERFRF